MKTIHGTLVSLCFACVAAACATSSSTAPEPAAAQSVEPRVSAAQATQQIATAECEREQKCNTIGESLKFSSAAHCHQVKSEALNKDFNDDADCKNGILAKDLRECVTKTTEQTCDGLSSVVGNAERSAECGSRDLCMD